MPDTLVKLKTGTIARLSEKNQDNTPAVPLEEGSVYFAVNTVTHTGRIVYDAPDGQGGVDRIVMSTDAEYAEEAEHAALASYASIAGALDTYIDIDGIKTDGTNNVIHYGVSDTAAATATKTVNVGDKFELITGARVTVKYTYTNTADSPLLSVSGTTAKAIYYQGNPIDKKYLVAGEVHQYVYDGTYWLYVGTIADNVLIYVDEARETLFITTSLASGDGVRY